jgi:hypothetical protein
MTSGDQVDLVSNHDLVGDVDGCVTAYRVVDRMIRNDQNLGRLSANAVAEADCSARSEW